MDWIKIDSETQLPKDKKLLMFRPDAHSYEVLSFWGEDGSDEKIQIWQTDCGDTMNGDLQWFNDQILDLYSHYLILNEPNIN